MPIRESGLRQTIPVAPKRTSLFRVFGKGLDPSKESDLAQLQAVAQGIEAGDYSEDQIKGFIDENPAAAPFITPVISRGKSSKQIYSQPNMQSRINAAISAGRMDIAEKLSKVQKDLTVDPGGLFSKINPKDYTQESVKRFAETQDFASLDPREDTNARSDRMFTQTTKLRDEFRNLSKDYIDVRDAYGRIQESAKNPSAAGDLALIFNYMKMLDPGSTVREGEFATAQNSAGIPDRVRAMYNRSIAGERLAPGTRNDFTSRAGSLYKRQLSSHKKNTAQYNALAKRYNIDPQNVTTDFTMDEMPAQIAPQTPQAAPSNRVRRYNPATGTFE